MKIFFTSDHFSYEKGTELEVPDFSVLTGRNGSGKSQLLRALADGKAYIKGLEKNQISLVDANTFRIPDESHMSGAQVISNRDQAWAHLTQIINRSTSHIETVKAQIGAGRYQEIKEQTGRSNTSFAEAIENITPSYGAYVEQYFGINLTRTSPALGGLYALALRLPFIISDLTRSDFDRYYRPTQSQNVFLPYQLSHAIWDYYLKLRNNQLNQYLNDKKNANLPMLSDEDFEIENGPKPWDLLNSIMGRFENLQYEILSPEGRDVHSNYQLKLTSKVDPKVEIDFSALSSGEQTLFALVGAVYQRSTNEPFPKAVLMDELDASLHPSMIKNLFSVIEELFLSRQIPVILATHSPTTVALAPENSLHILERVGRERVRKTSRKEALTVLTEGFATIDQGMLLLSSSAENAITILTEGHNAGLINFCLSAHQVDDAAVIEGVESITGTSQLKTLFDFFSKIPHASEIVFILDCEVKQRFASANRTHWIVIPTNAENTIAKDGIENAFDPELLDGFTNTTVKSNGKTFVTFDSSAKRQFAEKILGRKNADDVAWFAPLAEVLSSITQSRRVGAPQSVAATQSEDLP